MSENFLQTQNISFQMHFLKIRILATSFRNIRYSVCQLKISLDEKLN